MTNVAAQAISYPNPLTISVGDGTGGIQEIALPYFGSMGLAGGSNSEFGGQQFLIALLQAIWSYTAASATSDGSPVTGGGTGSGSISVH